MVGADAGEDTLRKQTKIDEPELTFFIPLQLKQKNNEYHGEDYGFFYNNLKQNIADRIKTFTEKSLRFIDRDGSTGHGNWIVIE
jgi:hypothetical protein